MTERLCLMARWTASGSSEGLEQQDVERGLLGLIEPLDRYARAGVWDSAVPDAIERLAALHRSLFAYEGRGEEFPSDLFPKEFATPAELVDWPGSRVERLLRMAASRLKLDRGEEMRAWEVSCLLPYARDPGEAGCTRLGDPPIHRREGRVGYVTPAAAVEYLEDHGFTWTVGFPQPGGGHSLSVGKGAEHG
ncbi:hypothetical protein E4582_07125 [Luteimonas yindakuii]|uniref:Uncharacterized protein n=1 Tax=Luteimonas yindakuii TaxID=2565782 RepID=A0A4Z1RIJ5_9GAMM|nr:hypothetical protein [Luteimonas yindakuii]TKS54547.1 hypothetical protein E4582_07125 [Luteimonas yindakuii]